MGHVGIARGETSHHQSPGRGDGPRGKGARRRGAQRPAERGRASVHLRPLGASGLSPVSGSGRPCRVWGHPLSDPQGPRALGGRRIPCDPTGNAGFASFRPQGCGGCLENSRRPVSPEAVGSSHHCPASFPPASPARSSRPGTSEASVSACAVPLGGEEAAHGVVPVPAWHRAVPFSQEAKQLEGSRVRPRRARPLEASARFRPQFPGL